MSETTQTERDGSRHTAEMSEAQQVGMATTGEFMLRLLNDADRLARVERQAFFRDELEARGIEVPKDAVAWERDPTFTTMKKRLPEGCAEHCLWITGLGSHASAPDLLPDTEGPCWRAILD